MEEDLAIYATTRPLFLQSNWISLPGSGLLGVVGTWMGPPPQWYCPTPPSLPPGDSGVVLMVLIMVVTGIAGVVLVVLIKVVLVGPTEAMAVISVTVKPDTVRGTRAVGLGRTSPDMS